MDATTIGLVSLLVSSPVIGVVVAKYFRPNATPLEILDQVQEERDNAVTAKDSLEARYEQKLLDQQNRHDAQLATERAGRVVLEGENVAMREALYVARAHIALGKPPPPPPWPAGVRP